MGRIVILAPPPPAPGGEIAAALIGELEEIGFRERHDILVPWPIPEDVGDLIRTSDVTVYHVGNDTAAYRRIYELATAYPSLLVLHSLALDELVAGLLRASHPLAARTRMEAEAVKRGLRRIPTTVDSPLQTPWCAYPVRRARGAAVFGGIARGYLEEMGSLTPVFQLPPVVPREERVIRERIVQRRMHRIMERDLLVGVLGVLGPNRRLDVVGRALRLLDEPVHLAAIGRRVAGFEPAEELARAGWTGPTTIATDASDADVRAWIGACDVLVSLRHPDRGELDLTMTMALADGVPVVTRAAGVDLEWPEEGLVRLPGGPPRAEELAAALRVLLRNPELRRAVGDRAREHIARLRAERSAGHAYAHAIEETQALVKDPARAVMAKWARALREFGAGIDAPEQGLGLRVPEALAEFRT